MNTFSFPGTVSTSNSIGPLFARLFRFIGVVQSIVLDGTTPVSNRNLLRCLLWLLDRYLFCILPSCMISNGLVFYHREPSIGRICRAGTNPNRVFALENWTKIYRNLMWDTLTSSTSKTSQKWFENSECLVNQTVWSFKWVRMRWDPIRREFRFVTRMMMSRQRRGRWYALSSFPETISKGKSTPFWFQNLKFSPPTAACTSNPL